MTDREFFIKTVADEAPRFERVLKALPVDKLDYKPHEKSRSALEVAAVMSAESSTFSLFLKTGVVDMGALGTPSSKTAEEAAAKLTQFLGDTEQIAKSMSEADWGSAAKMMAGEKVEWETTKGGMAWGLLLDLIHHRGQLSAYIRPMGGKVPSIYGPSADST
jgi:uncharacterized damage-inducible protein DinB